MVSRRGNMHFNIDKGGKMEKVSVPFQVVGKDVLWFIEEAIKKVRRDSGKYPGVLTVSDDMDKRIRKCVQKRTGIAVIGPMPKIYGLKYEIDPMLPEGRAVVHD